MHFEVLTEDQSGKIALEVLLPIIVGDKNTTYRVISYKGIGHLPKELKGKKGLRSRLLLNKLPKLLQGYGMTYANYQAGEAPTVIVVCDLDDRDLREFLSELNAVLQRCTVPPKTYFCFAIEEGEAWFLGDITAIKEAYPKAQAQVLDNYQNDAICGTWELLADAIYSGGAKALKKRGSHAVGKEKAEWAERIAPRMNVARNQSPSFNYFVSTLQELSEVGREEGAGGFDG